MEKVTYTLRIKDELLKAAKIKAVEENKRLNVIIEELLKNYLVERNNVLY